MDKGEDLKAHTNRTRFGNTNIAPDIKYFPKF